MIYIPFDKDLSSFSVEELKNTLKFFRRFWCKPQVWHLVIPAYLAIKYELEYRNAIA